MICSTVNHRKRAINIFYGPAFGKNRDFAEWLSTWAGSSYPLFLWITMCIRVRKLQVSERIRGLRMN
ncbi:hypothetical protein E0D81_12580 [Lelliottia amnigena]|nr:hypothetical protein E0D81_12580 [Lelliottia amnigena]